MSLALANTTLPALRAGSLPCQGFRLYDSDTPATVDASADQRFLLQNDFYVAGNATVDGSLTVRPAPLALPSACLSLSTPPAGRG